MVWCLSFYEAGTQVFVMLRDSRSIHAFQVLVMPAQAGIHPADA
jgi:hypothetical protein